MKPGDKVTQGDDVVVTGKAGEPVLVTKNGKTKIEQLDDEGELRIKTDDLEPGQKIVISDLDTFEAEVTVISTAK